ncbi:MAG: autotransporter-associated beta strand repeat-containing protein, partial [Thermoguttaceae bacterium]
MFETTASTLTVSSTATPTVHNVTFNVSDCLIGGGASGNLQLKAGSTSTFNVNGGTATVSAVLAGSGSNLTKTGTGLLVLSGSNTYTGSTTVGSGTLQLGDGTNDGSVAGSIANNSALIFNNHADQTVAGAISGSGVLTKNNTGVLTLSRTNSYSGETMINAGVIKVRSTSALGTSAGSTSVARGAALYLYTSGGTYSENLNLAGYGVSKNAGALTNYSGDNTWAGKISVDDAGQYTVIRSYVGTLTITGDITLADHGDWSDTSGQLTFADNQGGTTSASVVVSGNISGGSATQWSISKVSTGSNPGTLTLSGVNTYVGCTEISAGTLSVRNGSAIPDQSVVAIDKHSDYAYTAMFQVVDSETIGSLMSGNNATTCNGTVLINSGATLSTGAKGETVMRNSYVGLIAGEGGLEKVGTGRQILRNDNNTYGGGTTVSSGTLTALGTQTLGTGSVQVNGSTARLEIGSSLSGVSTVTLTNGTISSSNVAGTGTLTGTSYAVQQGVVGVSLGGAGGLTKTGDGTVALTCANSYSGKTVVTGGTLVAVQDTSLGAAPGSAVADQLTLDGGTLRCSRGVAGVTVTFPGDWYPDLPTATITGGGGSGATAIVNGVVRSVRIRGGSVKDGWTTLPTVVFAEPDMAGGTTATGSLTATWDETTQTYTVTGVAITNGGSGYSSNPAVLLLYGKNQNSTAEMWGETFKMSVSSVVLASGAGYGYTSAPTVTFSGGNATATATLTSSSMTLAATRGITLGSNGGTIEIDPGYVATVAGVISGSGTLIKNGRGTLKLTGANTYGGDTIVQAGALQMNSSSYATVLSSLRSTGLDLQSGLVVFDYTGDSTLVSNVKSLLATGYAANWATGQIRNTTSS